MSDNLIVSPIIKEVSSLALMNKEDANFLVKNACHLNKVFSKSYMWRTDSQKRSIISDANCPTLHAKFHQAILEQKVQTDQAMYLAKDYELKQLDVEELLLDLEELGDTKRDDIKKRKLNIELKFHNYELTSFKTAMHYRMLEVKGWQVIEDSLIEAMKKEGLSDEIIWSKESGEVSSSFFLHLTRMQGLDASTDSAEVHNLISLAMFSVQQAQQSGMFKELVKNINPQQQSALDYLEKEGYIKL